MAAAATSAAPGCRPGCATWPRRHRGAARRRLRRSGVGAEARPGADDQRSSSSSPSSWASRFLPRCELDPGGRLGAPEQHGHLGDGPILVIVEDDRRALATRELADRPGEVVADRPVRRRRHQATAHEPPQAVALGPSASRGGSRPGAPTPRDAHNARSRPIEIQLDEGVLGDLLGSGPIAKHQLDRPQDSGELVAERRRVVEGRLRHPFCHLRGAGRNRCARLWPPEILSTGADPAARPVPGRPSLPRSSTPRGPAGTRRVPVHTANERPATFTYGNLAPVAPGRSADEVEVLAELGLHRAVAELPVFALCRPDRGRPSTPAGRRRRRGTRRSRRRSGCCRPRSGTGGP